MASLDLQTVLGAPNLCGLIQETKSGIPNPFPDPFFAVEKKVDGDQGSYYKVTGQRGVATQSAYGAAPKARQLRNIVEVPVKLIHSIEEANLPILAYQRLLKYDDLAVQQMGYSEVSRQVTEFKQVFANTRIAAMTSALFNGKIWYDAAGNFLPSATNAANTIDFGFPTNNGTAAAGTPSNVGIAVDPLGTGTAIAGRTAGDWSTNTTDIDKQVRALKQAVIQLTGYELAYAFYGKNVPTWLAKNTTVQAYLSRAITVVDGRGGYNQEYIGTAEVPDGVLDLRWRKAYQTFFEDQNGVVQPQVGDNQIMLCPEPSFGWLGMMEGSYVVVDNAFRVQANPEESIVTGNRMVHGMFSYGIPSLKPPTATIVAGDTFLPYVKNPKVVVVLTVA